MFPASMFPASMFPASVFPGASKGAGIIVTQAAPGPVQPGVAYRFDAPVDATDLSISVQDLATGGYVGGTASYDSGTRVASWVADPATPLARGVKYLVTISGVTAADGTPLDAPITFSFTPAGTNGVRFMPGGGRRVARLTA